jgi:2-polyprenyl-3-methyl-5-hydroxy-6-metoxy-1,4-benzoquinol methylase
MAPPTDVEALAQQAEAQLNAGDTAGAARLCRMVLEANPTHVRGLMIGSVLCLVDGHVSEAEALLLRGCEAYPLAVEFPLALGRLRVQTQRFAEALAPFESCVLLQPDNRELRTALFSIYQARLFTSFDERSKQALSTCLKDDQLSHELLHKTWLSLLRLDPEAQELWRLFGSEDYSAFSQQVASGALRRLQDNAFFLAGLQRFLVPDPSVERGLTFTRRWLCDNRSQAAELLPLLCTLARYCFLAEYVFTCDEDVSFLSGALSSPGEVALAACYEPLHRRPDAMRLALLSDAPCYRELMRLQVLEPLQEAVIATTIPSVTAVEDAVSRAVREQYEENPYPPWSNVGARVNVPAALRQKAEGRAILMAGCGTGREAVEMALLFPAAQVQGIDLSRTSLAYARRKALELGADNLQLQQGDLLKLHELPQAFDLIVSVGVLHHLRDPRAGLRILLQRLRPGGSLRIGLYSTIGRQAISAARAWISDEGFPPTREGIRAFRACVGQLEQDHPIRRKLESSYDYYGLSSCRDLLFHVQEHTFTLLQIHALIREQGLKVLRVDTKSPAHTRAYAERFPADPSATDLVNWHALELEHPTVFAGLYSIWLARRDETPDSDWITSVQQLA